MSSEYLRRRDLIALSTTGMLATAGCLSRNSKGTIRVPDTTKVGEPIQIHLSEFDPNTSVTLKTVATDGKGRRFEGSWSLQTDENGEAIFTGGDSADRAPESVWYGSGRGPRDADQSAVEMIFHRLSPEGLLVSPSNFTMDGQNTVEVAFRASSGFFGGSAVNQTCSRVYIDSGIARQSIRTNRLVGWLYQPPSQGPHPAVIVLHGSAAAIPHRLSRMLATQGYATLALQYFDASGLPDSLRKVPLEYFDRAIEWLTNQPSVQNDGIGLIGFSRGVEAALLTAVNREGPTTVIGYSGSGVISHGVSGVPPRAFVNQPAWTRNGKRIASAESIGAVFDAVEEIHQHQCNTESLPESIRSRVSREVLDQVVIPVEDINGPILLLAGVDDRQWPTTSVSTLTIDRLQQGDHPYPYGLQAYCNAGHIFTVPYADYTGSLSSDQYGGTPEANARAAADAWPLVLAYLRQGL